MTGLPRLLATGFGPFPGAPDNPTERLVAALARESPETFGAGALKAVVLPTEYQRSWAVLRRTYAAFRPDIVVHFGLSARATTLRVETLARNRVDVAKPDAAEFAPRSGLAQQRGPERRSSTLPVDAILAALLEAGIEAELSDDAGSYVCNATLYRSLAISAGSARRVGFIHVPGRAPPSQRVQPLLSAARVILKAACAGVGRVER